MFTGVTGLLGNGEAINVIGNNIANVNTIGFKGARMLFSDMLSASIGNNSQIGRGMQIQKVDNLFSQSSTQTSSIVTDLAVQGDGFFVLGGPSANAVVPPADAYYTRAGAFRLDNGGGGANRYLVNPDNYRVLDQNGAPIAIPNANGAQTLQKVVGVDANGVISLLYSDATTSSTMYYAGPGAINAAIGSAVRVGFATVPNAPGMIKEGGTLFRATGNGLGGSGVPTITYANGTNQKLLSNNLEMSNVDLATEFVNMIVTQRAYSANSKTITTADEMTQEVLNLKR